MEREKENKFMEACHYGDLEVISTLIGQGVDVNAQHLMNGWSGLHWACKSNQIGTVEILLSNGVNAMLENFEGQTAHEISKNEVVLKMLANYRMNCDEGPQISNCSKSQPIKSEGSPPPLPENNREIPPAKIVKETFSKPDVRAFSSVRNGFELGSMHDSCTSPINLSLELPAKPPINLDGSKDFTVKIRIAHISDGDFIEVDLPTCDLTYGQLLLQCCKELALNPQSVERIRKLPNTRLRNDKDVRRLRNFEELELVVKGVSSEDAQCNGGQKKKSNSKNDYQSITNFHNQTILY